MRGTELTTQVMTSINDVMSALDIISEYLDGLTKGSANNYAFLIHNSCVIYRTLCRPLLRDGHRPLLVPSITRITDMMETLIDGSNGNSGNEDNDMIVAMYINYLIDTATCYNDADEYDDAAKYIGKALTLCKKPPSGSNNSGGKGSKSGHNSNPIINISSDLKDRVLRYAVHINRSNQRAVDIVGSDLEKKAGDEYIVGARAIYLVQKMKSGCIKSDDMEKTLVAALTSIDYQPDETDMADTTDGALVVAEDKKRKASKSRKGVNLMPLKIGCEDVTWCLLMFNSAV
jgi:hypothetical protein